MYHRSTKVELSKAASSSMCRYVVRKFIRKIQLKNIECSRTRNVSAEIKRQRFEWTGFRV